jgi:16S rRNA (guanine527-N7)-methyltransferase
MANSPLATRIAERLTTASVHPDPDVVQGLERYIQLLARWNARINLTALPLQPPTDASIDKLLVEPLAGVPFFPARCESWIDLGSGGGSPALPLRLACPQGSLTLVESRERKCAFLREAVRALALGGTAVTNARFETLEINSPVDVVTVRAVRIDGEIEALVLRILRSGGFLFCFGTPLASKAFTVSGKVQLPDGSTLTVATRVS